MFPGVNCDVQPGCLTSNYQSRYSLTVKGGWNKMIFEDIIALAKAGYTPADVREFLKADQPKAEASSDGFTGEAPAEKTETPKGEKSGTEESQDLDESPDDPKNATEAEAEPDYKAKYEAAEKALKAAQAANTKQQQPEVKDDQKIFSEAAALFM